MPNVLLFSKEGWERFYEIAFENALKDEDWFKDWHMNKNYQKGVRFERERKKFYESKGYTVVRASGSHSPFDLVAVLPGSVVLLIQCKTTKDKGEAARLLRNFKGNPPLTPFGNYVQVMEVKVGGKVLSESV